MTPEIEKLENDRCECVLSIRGGYTCFRCRMLKILWEDYKIQEKQKTANTVQGIGSDHQAAAAATLD